MARSTQADKARQLNAAHHLLQRGIPLSKAVQRLSREFDLSGRQAYRYLEQAPIWTGRSKSPRLRCR
jgi:hypothetical protein